MAKKKTSTKKVAKKSPKPKTEEIEKPELEGYDDYEGDDDEDLGDEDDEDGPKLNASERALLSENAKKYDPSATADDCIKDIRNVQEKYKTKRITRNFYRVHGKYSEATWNQFFGTFLEFRRQGGLELSRQQHKLEREIAKHASVDHYRKFYQEEVLPYHDKYAFQTKNLEDRGRWKTVLVGSDLHDIELDRFCYDVFLDTAKRMQPEVIVLNGDIFDNYEFSRYTTDPRKFDIAGRFKFVDEHIFAPLRKAAPNAQIDLIAGNHEWRLLNVMADKTPHMRTVLSDVMGLTLADVFGLKKHEINFVCKVDLAAWNNHDKSNELAQNYRQYYGCFVASHFKDLNFGMSGTSGHSHRPETVTFANLPMGKMSWITTGCMCQTEVEYVSHMDKWTNSFMVANIDNHRKIVSSEHFMIPGDHVTVGGKRYVRSF